LGLNHQAVFEELRDDLESGRFCAYDERDLQCEAYRRLSLAVQAALPDHVVTAEARYHCPVRGVRSNLRCDLVVWHRWSPTEGIATLNLSVRAAEVAVELKCWLERSPTKLYHAVAADVGRLAACTNAPSGVVFVLLKRAFGDEFTSRLRALSTDRVAVIVAEFSP
jgi:hypothetical protein